MNHHPRRVKNEIIDQDEILGLIKEGQYATIALSNADIPYIVTLSYGFDEKSNCLYFHCANKGDKLDYIRNNNRICATIIKDKGYLKNQCDHNYASLIIRGTIFIATELAEKKHALQVLLNHLEDDPQPIFERNIHSDKSYDAVTILRLDIESIIGKKHL